jgi:PAS domain S-box-containing protein
VENPAAKALREGRVIGLSNHTILISRNGSGTPIDDSAAPMVDDAGVPVGTVLVFRDVTGPRRAEEAQARLAAIVESSQDAIISKTLQGVIRTWNAGAERLFGYKSEEVVGQPITLIIPPDRLGEETDILSRISRGERIEHYETVRITKDGRPIDISLTISPVRDAEGQIIGASKIARDITERKQAEEALSEAVEALQAADRRKDEFLAVLAHELRNPLAPLRNGLQVMRLAAGDAAMVARTRDMMDRQLSHMVRLIDDLLDVSRIRSNKMELRRSRVLLADVVSSAVETARPALEAAGQELTVALPPEPVYLEADLTRLAQAFGNLLNNSAKYMERGGRVWLAATRQADEVIVTIRDTGIGIPADALPTIFDLFSQVDRSLERSAGGLGIGLALVKGLVEMHGGTVEAASPGQGRGSTFTVRLPVLPSRAEQSTATPAEEWLDSSGSKRRVLVVDDNFDSAASMAMMLQLLGNEVRTAHDGEEAVELAEQLNPQLVLMDLGMPKLNGFEATRRIRDQPWGREMVIIALTGWGQEADRAQSKEAGCNGHLVKPVDLAALEKTLAELRC